MRYLVSGHKGFLFSSLPLEGTIVPYEDGSNYFGVDEVIHFACPNDKYEFQDIGNMAYMMVDYSIGILEQALNNGAKFIFASSHAAVHLQDDYGVYKKSFEQYIHARTDNYLIYRIPRIYGSDRKKGLMRQLRENDIPDSDMDKEVDYLDISDFQKWFMENMDKTGIITYDGEFRRNTIKEIEKIYI